MVALASRKIIFFCAGQSPTVEESLMISRIIAGQVLVRRADLAASESKFSGGPEPADGVAIGAGVTLPTAYAAYPVVNGPNADGPQFVGISVEASEVAEAGTVDFKAFALNFDATTRQISVEDITASCDWSSDDTDTATVGASTGVVTGVAEGEATITASYEYTSGKPPIVGSAPITVTA